MKPINIFISSTMDDLEPERKAVVDILNKMQYINPIFAEEFPADSRTPREVCEDRVKECHIYIGIFWKRYGYEPVKNNDEKYSVPIIEYNQAKKSLLPRLIFIKKEETNYIEKKLKEFLKTITDFDTGRFRNIFEGPEELAGLIKDAVNSEIHRGFFNSFEKRYYAWKELYKDEYFYRVQEDFSDE